MKHNLGRTKGPSGLKHSKFQDGAEGEPVATFGNDPVQSECGSEEFELDLGRRYD